MPPHARATIAAAAHAFISGRKVAGVYDHATGRHLRLAAEARGEHLQGYDGERDARFGGTLPELYDAGDGCYLSMEIDGGRARGFDRRSAGFFTADVTGSGVQVYDHAERAWFAFDVQSA